jgi:ribonuclease BN (tRNA processing enzyme)
LVNIPFTVGYEPKPENIYNLKSKIRLHELLEEGENIPFKAYAIPQHHAYGDHGFRFEIEEKVVGYTGDCGVSDGLNKLAKNANILITECNNKDTPQDDPWGHLDPYLAANVAKEAGVNRLILTHFGPINYPTAEDREWAQEEARKIFPNTEVAFDLSEFALND